MKCQPAGGGCTFSQGPSVYVYPKRNLCKPDPQGHHEWLCREEAVTQCELPSARECKVKPEWTSVTFTAAGTACVGPGHHFVPSSSREVKPHLSCHGLQPMLPQALSKLTFCHPFCFVHPALVLILKEV